MKRNFYLLFILLVCKISFAQNETNNWYFGDRAALNISNSSETALKNSAMIALNGCASISDRFGNLVFYTNGENIYNKNHTVLKNGLRVLGNRRSVQNSIIIPILNDSNKYYLFTSSGSLYISELDISKDNGLGEVIKKDNLLIPSGVRGVTGVHHLDGESIWVIATSSSQLGEKYTSFYAYLIKRDGTIEPPIITKDVFYERKGDGVIKISPNGKKIALANLNNDTSDNLVIFDFDNETGIINNKTKMIVSKIFFQVIRIYGLAFSNDSNFLYATAIDEVLFNGDINEKPISFLYQYNLKNQNPQDQLIIFEDNDVYEPGSLQLSRNGKIYRALKKKSGEKVDLLGQIKTPTELNNPNFEINIDLAEKKSELGLPNFIQSFFRTRILENSACAKNALTFNIDTYTEIKNATWDFGDGNTSTEIIPTHTFIKEGKYIVKATILLNNSLVGIEKEKEIEVYPLPIINNNSKLLQCDNGTSDNRFNLNDIKSQINNNADLTFQFYESSEDAKKNIKEIINTNNYKNTSNPQTLFARVTNLNNCYEIANFNIELANVRLGEIDEIYSCGIFNKTTLITEGNFNLENKRQQIYSQFNLDTTNTISFYKNENEAQTKRNELTNNYTSKSGIIWLE